jgi:hydrogenase nickel incorporation protein HypA/HybF
VHELSVAQSLLDVALAEARRAGAVRVTRLHCRIGDLCAIQDDLMAEAFGLLCVGTPCEGAELRVEKTFLRAKCRRCERDFDVRNWDWHCPQCGGEGELIGGGDELELTSIEAEVEE